ncbi:MAG: DUF4906 domain-containing protein [Bacteroidales bacterium]|nr:DUF4906 domain-containing protein [Bacteroidales bacterium]
MKRRFFIKTLLAVISTLLVLSCAHTMEEDMPGSNLPVGTPITMRLDFGASDPVNLEVSTKAESSRADEERVHDLYVMIFCNNPEHNHYKQEKNKIYGRYFSYEHLNRVSLENLDNSQNEGWWVENKTMDTAPQESSVAKTTGAVKISTQVCDAATLVVIANLNNSICKVGNSEDQIAYLNGIQTLEQLKGTQVRLQQDIVNRKDLFLMMGTLGGEQHINTGDMKWGTTPKNYDENYKVSLKALDAKVKFKIKYNPDNISSVRPVNWEVDNVPNRCYLFSDYNGGKAPEETVYFDSEPAYFDGMEGDWYVYSFYMLESRNEPKAHATQYHDREKQTKKTTDEGGYRGNENEFFVENGEWIYALPQAPYVKFDLMLTLTPAGVAAMGGGQIDNALTTETVYTVHLGDFSNSALQFDDYNTLRSTCYTYEITIANSGSIFAEVKKDEENQPGQEGYLLLTNEEIVNADCHYENHSITFTYDPNMSPEKFSWYVKTPFTTLQGGGPAKGYKEVNGKRYPTFDPHDTDGTLLDYRWVKFSVNEQDNVKGYKTQRVAYPGDKEYDPDWGVGDNGPWNDESHPILMDASQFIQYLYEQTNRVKEGKENDFRTDNNLGEKLIRATIFIDEFYYEFDPRDESDHPQADPNLWRQFVNARPREMHILSKTTQSRDRQSDVIESSHSIVQQSIQSIYNVFEPTLKSIWGCEHMDEIKVTTDGVNLLGNWPYWPEGCSDNERSGANNEVGKENGRLNSAYIWGLYSSQGNNGTFYLTEGHGKRYWEHFLKYEVDNTIPELRDDADGDTFGNDDGTHKFHGMAWSCLTRNRDNNGNGTIEPEEVRWYLASTQQLAGIWVGTYSLSSSARLYQPAAGEWRSHVVSSTAKLVSWSEEGGGATNIQYDYPPSGGPNTSYHTWGSVEEATKGESVRCIRNIGTYDDPQKGQTDITYAPVTELPDKYFTVSRSDGGDVNSYTPGDPDLYYIFHFDRLNTKSIREFTSGELPYHDQMSQNNQVYVKMVTQSLGQDVPAFNVKLGEINNLVSQAGHNDFCPEGYRFPNHTEYLLMSLYLPQDFLKKDKDGNNYPSRAVSPTRTYYDRGYYGSLKGAAWETEYEKVGWIYSDKLHCSPYNEAVNHSRCVRDYDQTGVISGKIAVEGNEIYPGDVIPVDFKFSSTASTFTDATLTLWYNKGGFRMPYDLSSQLKTPKGVQYIGKQNIRIPTLTDLGLSPENFSSADMSLEVVLTNLSGLSGSHTLNVSMVNPLDGACQITDAVDGNKIFPSDKNTVSLTLHTNTHEHNINSISLKLCYDDKEIPLDIPQLGIQKKTYTLDDLQIPGIEDLTGISASTLNAGDKAVTLKATVSTTYNNTRTSGTETLTKDYTQDLVLSNPVAGSIEGASYLYPAGNEGSVNFNFQSRAHQVKLSYAALKLQYTNPGTGEPTEYAITVSHQPSDKTYSQGQVIQMPNLSALGLSATDLPLSATLLAEVSDANGLKAQSSKSVTVKSHFGGTVDIVDGFDPALGFPITITPEVISNLAVQNVTLRWKKEGDTDYTEQTVPITGTGSTITAYWHPSFLDSDTDVLSDDSQTRTYYFTAIVGNSDDAGVIGLNESADPATMQFFKINYNPNPGTWTYNNQPPKTSKWYAQTVSNMDFEAGDFIDAYMDVSNCTYAPKNPNGPVDGSDLGMDNLISFGRSTQKSDGKPALEWSAGNGNVIFYYPARNGNSNNLQIAVLSNAISRVQPFDIPSGKLKVMLKRENDHGHLMLNNYGTAQEVEPDWINQEIRNHTQAEKESMAEAAQGRLDELTSRNTVYIGSTEGNHRSRANYKYVRVVRKHN